MSYQPFHLVDQRPWPILIRFCRLNFLTSFSTILIYIKFNHIFLVNFFLLIIISYQWWRDVNREAVYQGHHSIVVLFGLKLGIILFIVREIFFFLGFFWSYFHFFLSPDLELGANWPPTGVTPFNPYGLPLLNTTLLLSSGFTITWSHHRILSGEFSKRIYRLLVTILFGVIFLFLQSIEYINAPFSITDRAFGSVFFITTGFHGFHVFIGRVFLIVNIFRIFFNHFNQKHHFRFEAAAWYWHFVDVVWLFLFCLFYWWIV